MNEDATVEDLRARIEYLETKLSRSKANLKKAQGTNKMSKAAKKLKKGKKLVRRKGFDTKKTKVAHQPPTKKSSVHKLTTKPKPRHRNKEWKPPPIFAVADEDSFAVDDNESRSLKKTIFDHLKGAGVTITQTATAATIDEVVEAELKRCDNVSSIFLVNIGWVVDKYLQWKYLMPRVEPFYAVKANPDLNILRTLKMLGAGFDCASEAELVDVKALGQPSDKVIFANPCKGKSHIRAAESLQVDMMTFDNVDEVDKILAIYPAAKLVLRILPNDEYSLMPFGKKFGASWEESKALIAKCKAVKANLIGISFHVGSGVFESVAYREALVLSRKVFDHAIAEGFDMKLLDIGGGFPGEDDGPLRFDEIASVISPLLDEMFPKSSGVRIIAEPGRYFCSGSSTLAVIVNSRRRKNLVKDDDDADADDDEPEEEADDDDDEDDEMREGRPMKKSERGLLHSSASAPELAALEERALEQLLDLDYDPDLEGKDYADDSTSEECNRDPKSTVSDAYEYLYYLSDGVYGSFNNIIFDHAQPKPVLLTRKGETAEKRQRNLLLYKTRLFGPTCDSIDVLSAADCLLPELEIGDWLLFPQMGAYTVAAASSFNGFAPPNSTYVMEFDDHEDGEE